MLPNATNLMPKNASNYFCEFCDFKCSKKSNYETHLLTSKHQNATKCYQNATAYKQKNAFSKINCPICDKQFSHKSSMFRHKKNCNNSQQNTSEINNVSSLITPELIVELIKDNKEMKQLMIEFCKNGMNNNSYNTNQTNNNNNNINSNNKSFNLQFFLNETCKNAMNIMDFANSIQVKLTDLENIGELGYVEGISKIIIDNLKLLDVTQIPVHCSDFKREMMYVKDNDKWEKENDDKTKIKKLKNGLDTVQKLNPVSFKRKGKGGKDDIGLIAEEVDKILPQVTGKDQSGQISGLDYSKLTAVLIQAVKELSVEVDRLKNKIK
jgi:hypothetical protein